MLQIPGFLSWILMVDVPARISKFLGIFKRASQPKDLSRKWCFHKNQHWLSKSPPDPNSLL